MILFGKRFTITPDQKKKEIQDVYTWSYLGTDSTCNLRSVGFDDFLFVAIS